MGKNEDDRHPYAQEHNAASEMKICSTGSEGPSQATPLICAMKLFFPFLSIWYALLGDARVSAHSRWSGGHVVLQSIKIVPVRNAINTVVLWAELVLQ